MSPADNDNIEALFGDTPDASEALAKRDAIRAAGKKLAYLMLQLVPDGAERRDAIRQVTRAVNTANAAIHDIPPGTPAPPPTKTPSHAPYKVSM
jgi:hypothetical protein